MEASVQCLSGHYLISSTHKPVLNNNLWLSILEFLDNKTVFTKISRLNNYFKSLTSFCTSQMAYFVCEAFTSKFAGDKSPNDSPMYFYSKISLILHNIRRLKYIKLHIKTRNPSTFNLDLYSIVTEIPCFSAIKSLSLKFHELTPNFLTIPCFSNITSINIEVKHLQTNSPNLFKFISSFKKLKKLKLNLIKAVNNTFCTYPNIEFIKNLKSFEVCGIKKYDRPFISYLYKVLENAENIRILSLDDIMFNSDYKIEKILNKMNNLEKLTINHVDGLNRDNIINKCLDLVSKTQIVELNIHSKISFKDTDKEFREVTFLRSINRMLEKMTALKYFTINSAQLKNKQTIEIFVDIIKEYTFIGRIEVFNDIPIKKMLQNTDEIISIRIPDYKNEEKQSFYFILYLFMREFMPNKIKKLVFCDKTEFFLILMQLKTILEREKLLKSKALILKILFIITYYLN